MSKIFIYFSAIIIFIIISNSLRTSKNNEFFTKKYHDLGNLVIKKFHYHESQISYFKYLKKPVEIIFWHNLYPRELEIVKQSIKEFEQHNPNIKIKDVNKVNWEQICKSVANSLPVDKQPNIVFSYDDHIEFYSKSFKVVPLDIFIDYDEDFRNTPETKNKYSFLKVMLKNYNYLMFMMENLIIIVCHLLNLQKLCFMIVIYLNNIVTS
ncbi:MAG: hypothetical protein Q8879_00640 [Candidatus Phytoplasma australasiaticum]|nr:hypothetical protein [Candidatus Phytoplasma australasiaticum]